MTTPIERMPPQSVEAEETVLGSILNEMCEAFWFASPR
jgi:hypothetical protein